MIISSVAIGAVAASAAYLSPIAHRLARGLSLKRYFRQNPLIALTYDDGPSEQLTPRILDILQSNGAAATFFMLGRSAQLHPEMADRIVQEGHDVGCHSNLHLHAWKTSPWRAIDDIASGYHHLRRWVRSDGFFRPPYGKMTLPTYWAVRRRGADVWWWTVDSGDSHDRLPDPDETARELLRQGGGVVLMHDVERSPERDKFVLDTTAVVLELARKHAFDIRKLSDIRL